MSPRRRRIALIAMTIVVLVLITAPAALAAAGGGSSGFGGGGGGGHGGRGAGLYILIQILIRIAIIGHGLGLLIILGLVVMALLYTRGAPAVRHFWAAREDSGRAARRRTAQRERRVHMAAAEAAEDDPAFAPDVVKPAAAELFTHIQAAWDKGDRAALGKLVGRDLMTEWERRLDDFARRGWRNHVEPIGDPQVEYVGLTNRGSAEEDRVVVRIEAKLRDFVVDPHGNRIKRVGRIGDTVPVREYWTLGKGKDQQGSPWILLSIEHGAEGTHVLSEQIVASPWADEQSLRDESLVEGAMADALPDGVKPGEVAKLDFDGDAHAAALDLSLADGRFAPHVLEVAARRAVAAWASAVDGDDAPLLALADREAVQDMLYPGDPSRRTRMVVRGPQIKQITVTGLDAAAEPPTMSIGVEVEGRRYIEDRGTAAVIAGSQARATSFTEHWTLALGGDPRQPWRIVRVGSPLAQR